MKKVILVLFVLFFASSLLLTACGAPQEGFSCKKDGDCAAINKNCFEESGNAFGVSGYCLNQTCQCACGHRTSNGTFVKDMCN